MKRVTRREFLSDTVIAAAAAAYLGYKGSVKAVSYAGKTGWSAASRRSRTANVARGTMPTPTH